MTKSKPSLKRNTIQKKGYFTTVKCLVMINSLPGRHRVEVRTWSYQRHQSIISGQTLSKNCLILFNCNKLKNNHHTHQELRRKEFSSLSSLPIETQLKAREFESVRYRIQLIFIYIQYKGQNDTVDDLPLSAPIQLMKLCVPISTLCPATVKKPLWDPLLLDFVEFCCLETLVKSAQTWTYFGNSNRQH